MAQLTFLEPNESDRQLVCRCGCGTEFTQSRVGRVRYYVNDAHKRRALEKIYRARAAFSTEWLYRFIEEWAKGGTVMAQWVESEYPEASQFARWFWSMDESHRDWFMAALATLEQLAIDKA